MFTELPYNYDMIEKIENFHTLFTRVTLLVNSICQEQESFQTDMHGFQVSKNDYEQLFKNQIVITAQPQMSQSQEFRHPSNYGYFSQKQLFS